MTREADDLLWHLDEAKALTEDRLAERKRFSKALNELARLGNEPYYGNSVGNMIARKALGV